MSHLLSTSGLTLMLPNLAKLATIGSLLSMSNVTCKQGFSALSHVINIYLEVPTAAVIH